MQLFYVYETSTGRILWSGTCPNGLVSVQANEPGTTAAEGEADDALDYVLDGVVTPRPVFGAVDTTIVADGIDTYTLPLPAGVTVTVEGMETVVTDGSPLEFASEVAASWTISLDLFPYVPTTFTVTANAP